MKWFLFCNIHIPICRLNKSPHKIKHYWLNSISRDEIQTKKWCFQHMLYINGTFLRLQLFLNNSLKRKKNNFKSTGWLLGKKADRMLESELLLGQVVRTKIYCSFRIVSILAFDNCSHNFRYYMCTIVSLFPSTTNNNPKTLGKTLTNRNISWVHVQQWLRFRVLGGISISLHYYQQLEI